ncbi:MAG TPA: hypothetical protein VFI34_11645 [Candidatus Limnocylindrales bacterium]|nr:hypothetical protein [Candidatus Limnocylindrales bacterium]
MDAATRRRIVDIAIVAAPFAALLLVGATLWIFGVMIVAGATVGGRGGRYEAVWFGSVLSGAATGLVAAVLASHQLDDIAIGAIFGAISAVAFVTPGFLFGRAWLAVVDGAGATRAGLLAAAGLGLLIGGSILGALILVLLAGPFGP